MKTPKTVPARRLNSSIALLLTGLALVSCVTVNVNFPESAVQKASDDYVKDLYRTKEQGKPSNPKTNASPAAALQWIIPTAEAEPTMDLTSPKIDAIKAQMKAIVPDILEQKKAGVLGEDQNGKLVIKDQSKLKPLLKSKIENLVNEDGKLRESLYGEVISNNHLPANSMPAVKKSFSHSFQGASPSGTWVQGDDGTWSQKP